MSAYKYPLKKMKRWDENINDVLSYLLDNDIKVNEMVMADSFFPQFSVDNLETIVTQAKKERIGGKLGGRKWREMSRAIGCCGGTYEYT